MEQKQHGGQRPGAGRPQTDRKVALSVRISPEAADKLSTIQNKSEFIDEMIKRSI